MENIKKLERNEQPNVVFLGNKEDVNGLVLKITKLIGAALPQLKAIRYGNGKTGGTESCEQKMHREEVVANHLLSVLGSLWEAISELTRLRPANRENYRVTVFGSARIEPGTPAYDRVKQLGRELAKLGCMVITGGGPGFMQAANQGASEVGPLSVGVTVELPMEEKPNAYVIEIYQHKNFFSRLHQFIFMSDAYIVMDGGIGTLLETAMVWQLLQVRKLYHTPLIMVGDMWQDLVRWVDRWMLKDEQKLISPEDLRIPTCVAGDDWLEKTLSVIEEDMRKWREAHACPIVAQNA